MFLLDLSTVNKFEKNLLLRDLLQKYRWICWRNAFFFKVIYFI